MASEPDGALGENLQILHFQLVLVFRSTQRDFLVPSSVLQNGKEVYGSHSDTPL